jgi:hypothetical protein
MRVPTSIRYLLVLTAFFAVSADVSAAKPKKQDTIETRLQLEALGFPGFSARLLGEGASVLTVHFADDKHLLVTFGTRGLVARHAGEQHNDQDRMVAAELVEISSGRVVARTEWLLHDHGRYLWPLGHGRFLLRIENNLSTFAPAANLKEGHAFDRVVFAVVPGSIDAVSVATDNQLVLVNSSLPQPKHSVVALQSAPASRPRFSADAHQLPPRITSNDALAAADAVEHSAEILSFFRIAGAGTAEDFLQVKPAGTIFTSSIVALPVYSDGYLQPLGQDHIQWHIVFHSFSGKSIPLAPVETSCAPNMTRVGPAQFVAMTCRGVSANVMLVAYDLEQHEIWDEPLPESDVPPSFAVAASAGRFAISRFLTTTVTTDSSGSLSPLAVANSAQVDPTITTNQDLRIYQTQTGDLLLKAAPSPAFKTGENFDLSADGLRAAIVHDKTIDIYRLPELTKLDKEDLAELAKFAPPPSTDKISFSGLPGAMVIDTPTEASSPASPPNVVVLGDTNRPAQPPSLLTDGEKAQFPEKSTKKPE